jgi:hypothetical protein
MTRAGLTAEFKDEAVKQVSESAYAAPGMAQRSGGFGAELIA